MEALESRADYRARRERGWRLAHFKTLKYLPATPGMPFRDNPWAGYKKIGDPGPGPIFCEDITDRTNEYSVDGQAKVLHHGEKF
jgi:hypothetical protein